MANPERVQLLVDALRSNEFEQCQGTLRSLPGPGDFEDGMALVSVQGSYIVPDRVRHCCLGVATEVAISNGLQLPDDLCACGDTECEQDPEECNDNYGKRPESIWDLSDDVLSQPVMDWYGFHDSDPVVDLWTGDTATTVNDQDVDPWDFNKIADGFEAVYLNVEPE